VSEVAVFGLADERLGEVPAAVIYSETDRALDAETMLGVLEGKLATFKHPARIWFVDQPLPKLGTGKIDRVALRAAYRDAPASG
jgi:acyl-CoA synthetase (AMP-forming)/AMP-acid ligase II